MYQFIQTCEEKHTTIIKWINRELPQSVKLRVIDLRNNSVTCVSKMTMDELRNMFLNDYQVLVKNIEQE